ncbi:hypothetical protein TNCV_1251681 [Trichonephila clavipes]|nr:hypothetical protein TNCV_1251681 [Trichonephila clavipes]
MEKTLHSASKRAFSTKGKARWWWSHSAWQAMMLTNQLHMAPQSFDLNPTEHLRFVGTQDSSTQCIQQEHVEECLRAHTLGDKPKKAPSQNKMPPTEADKGI